MKNALEGLRKAYTNLFVNPYSIFFIGFFALAIVYLFRGFVMHGQESYFFYRISNFVLENNIPNYDFLSFGGRAFFYSLGSSLFLVLNNMLLGISVETLLVVAPPVFGLLSLILFYCILRSFKLSRNVLSFACYILILSPVFLYSFTHFTSFTIPLFLNLLGFFFLIQKKRIFSYLSFLVYLLLPFFGFIHILFGLLLGFFYFYSIKKLKRFVPYAFIILLVLFLNNQFVGFGLDIINYQFRQLFFAFGGEYGLSIFLIFLSVFGLGSLWQKKYQNLIYYMFFLISIFFLILNIRYLIYINLILCILGAFGLRYIYKLKWTSALIRNLTVILLIGGVIFSGVSFLTDNVKQNPSKGLVDSLDFIGGRISPRDVVLSHEDYGIYINSISKKKNFIDFNRAYAPRLKERLFSLDKVFYSRSLTTTLNIFNEFKINHILITPEMKNGLVWNRGNEGLLYVLDKNPDYFSRMYNEGGYEVWMML